MWNPWSGKNVVPVQAEAPSKEHLVRARSIRSRAEPAAEPALLVPVPATKYPSEAETDKVVDNEANKERLDVVQTGMSFPFLGAEYTFMTWCTLRALRKQHWAGGVYTQANIVTLCLHPSLF